MYSTVSKAIPLLILTLIINGCSLIPKQPREVEIKTVEVRIPIQHPVYPRPIDMKEPKWYVVSTAKITNPCKRTISFEPKKFDENGVEQLKRPKSCAKEIASVNSEFSPNTPAIVRATCATSIVCVNRVLL